MIDALALEQTAITEQNTVRLISTAYIEEPAMAPLADNEEDLAVLEEIEGQTSARQIMALPIPGGLEEGELLNEAHGYGWTYVNAAFCYTRATGNRFNGPERGAWYASYGEDAANASVAEVSWHLSRELEATGIFDNLTTYRELWAGFTTTMHDLNGHGAGDVLHPDPKIAYPIGQVLAKSVFSSGGNGILYPSVRHENGKCLVAFRPNLVQNIRQGKTWKLFWSGSSTPEISCV